MGGGQISLKTLKAEKLGSNLVGRISTSPRFLMEIARLDSLSLVELGGEYFEIVSLEGSCILKLSF